MQQQNPMTLLRPIEYELESRKQAHGSSIIDSTFTGMMPLGASLWGRSKCSQRFALVGKLIQSNNGSNVDHTNSLGNNQFATNNRASDGNDQQN
jgi:hypothetical protein